MMEIILLLVSAVLGVCIGLLALGVIGMMLFVFYAAMMRAFTTPSTPLPHDDSDAMGINTKPLTK